MKSFSYSGHRKSSSTKVFTSWLMASRAGQGSAFHFETTEDKCGHSETFLREPIWDTSMSEVEDTTVFSGVFDGFIAGSIPATRSIHLLYASQSSSVSTSASSCNK